MKDSTRYKNKALSLGRLFLCIVVLCSAKSPSAMLINTLLIILQKNVTPSHIKVCQFVKISGALHSPEERKK